jgi:hypothetical protein
MNGDRQMFPVHTIRIRASSPTSMIRQSTRLSWAET